MAEKGKLIIFEGGDGSGKSERSEALAKALRARGFRVLLTREPGGTPLGQVLRTILFNKRFKLDPLTQMLLFFADRYHHLTKVVLPALAEGKIVILDRSWYSTWAYQIRGGELGEDYQNFFYVLLEKVVGNLRPDLVILLDIDPEEGLQRTKERGKQLTVFEEEDLNYHRRVREGFKEIIDVEMAPHEYVIVNTSPPPEEVHREILEAVERLEFT